MASKNEKPLRGIFTSTTFYTSSKCGVHSLLVSPAGPFRTMTIVPCFFFLLEKKNKAASITYTKSGNEVDEGFVIVRVPFPRIRTHATPDLQCTSLLYPSFTRSLTFHPLLDPFNQIRFLTCSTQSLVHTDSLEIHDRSLA